MPEFRQDPLTERWVLLAPDRASRPNAFTGTAATASAAPCPFCPGNESACPAPLYVLPSVEHAPSAGPSATPPAMANATGPGPRDSTAPPWRLRVVPNLYPAVVYNSEPPAASTPGSRPSGLYQQAPAVGSHEVVIETPRHITRACELTAQEVRDSFAAYARRFRAWRDLPGLRWGLAFKNDGPAAGASLEHVHSQLVALNALPPQFQLEWDGAARWQRRYGNCIYCAMMADELAQGERLVESSADCLAFCPYASRVPYETWILPRAHASHFETTADNVRDRLAETVLRTIRRLQTVLPGAALNYVIHSAPFDTTGNAHYHWHIEIIPRIAHLAGFEWGTAQHINLTAPEQAAESLRHAQTGQDVTPP